MSLPDGLAVRFTEYQGHPKGARAWMRDWFVQRRAHYERADRGELNEPTAVISLAVRRAPRGDGFELEVATILNYPAAPEDWPEVPYGNLLDRAIGFLSEAAAGEAIADA